MAARTDASDAEQFDHYLPGMPRLSTSPGRIERLVGRLRHRWWR